MSYIDVEQELNHITDSLEEELRAIGVIDADGKVIITAPGALEVFNQIIDKKIDECSRIRTQMEVSGKRFDANSANIIEARIEFLRTIRGAQSVKAFASSEPSHEKEVIQKFETKKKTKSFLDGNKIVGTLKKIFHGNSQQAQGRNK